MLRWVSLLALLLALGPGTLLADPVTITVGGTITQDALGGAVNNPALNGIVFGDSFLITFNLSSGITGAGSYSASNLAFDDTTAGVVENAFDPFSLLVATVGSGFEFTLEGCLTGLDCATGNRLDLIFDIAATDVNGSGAATSSQLVPADLLEDDGATDIHGDVSTYAYSNSVPTPTPEPASLALVGAGLVGMGGFLRKRAGRSQ